ncbi:MAG TPA: permease-like cell division protein FtsX [Polyangiales bacterium]
MDLRNLYQRAKRGAREDVRLYLVAISSLTVAFLCLSSALLGLTNLRELAERWGRTHHMSVYLKDGSDRADVDRLLRVLDSLPALAGVEYVSPQAAREQFLRDADAAGSLAALPVEAFPASIEVEFEAEVNDARINEVAQKVTAFSAVVDQVDTYRSWFERLASLLSAGRIAALLLSLLVIVCSFAVVSNTIRLSVAQRRDEIEMLRMCGATDAFVRGPFVVEGTLQGLFAAVLALLILGAAFLALRTQVDAALAPLSGMRLSFLSPLLALAILTCGAGRGALGSAVSIRRYLQV